MISRLIEHIKDWWYGIPELGARSSRWPKLRNDFLKKNPKCFCGKKGEAIHHRIPVSVDSSKELLWENLITLCNDHHLYYGHLGSFHSYNDELDKWIKKVKDRP